ncbi:MAG: hypothetical protein ACKV2T_26110 [Kofleriaceae bacterium]
MRFSVVISVLVALCGLGALAGCPISRSDELTAGGDPGDDMQGSPGGYSSCTNDVQCELAASSCCECPSFSTNRDDPQNGACTGIACPNPPTCPANVRAACNLETFQCEVVCVQIMTTRSCPDGYAIDPATGCLSDTCAAPTAGSCSLDADCVQTREDCCGCARGGRDTAVPLSALAAYDQLLVCPSNPQCPGTDTCDPASSPRCVQGACILTGDAVPSDACTGPCADGGTCVLNRDPAATTHGVGVCVP